MASQFERFVNNELPKRISTDADPLSVAPGKLLVTTGIGLGVIPVDPREMGASGKSAYEIAVDHGFAGTEQEWLGTLKGPSAFEVAVANGFTGTQAQWTASITALYDLSPENEGKVLTHTGTGTRWATYPFSEQFKTHMHAAGIEYVDETGVWKIDQGTM